MKWKSDQKNSIRSKPNDRRMLKINGLDVNYDKVKVLTNINLEIFEKEIVCLIGANGAGKTTLLKAISGLTNIKRGNIQVDGSDLRKLLPYNVAKLGIAHVPQGRQIIPDLTVKDNLKLGSYRLKGGKHRKINLLMDQEFERFPILNERRNQIASLLSGGEQQMLAISRGLMMEPKFIMLDEPSIGLAPLIVEEIMKAIWRLHESGITVLLVEQAATLALAISHRGYVLKNGKIIIKGTAQELLTNNDVIKGYLGGN